MPKIPEQDEAVIRQHILEGMSYLQLAGQYGCDSKTVQRFCERYNIRKYTEIAHHELVTHIKELQSNNKQTYGLSLVKPSLALRGSMICFPFAFLVRLQCECFL